VQSPLRSPPAAPAGPFPPGWLRLGAVLGAVAALRGLFGPGGIDSATLALVEAKLLAQGHTLCRLVFGQWPWSEPRGWLWLAAALLMALSAAQWIGARRALWLTALAAFPGRVWLARGTGAASLAMVWPLLLGVSALLLAGRQRTLGWLLDAIGAWLCLLALSLAEVQGLGALLAAAAPVALLLAYRGRSGQRALQR
jgi:hypothetical protein